MKYSPVFLFCIWIVLALTGCQYAGREAPRGTSPPGDWGLEASRASSSSSARTSRDSQPYVPIQSAPGTIRYENDLAAIDISHSSDGYFMALYKGSQSKVKLLVLSPDQTRCYYDLVGKDFASFPFTGGDGTYSLTVYEQVKGSHYSTVLSVEVHVTLKNAQDPFLQPSQYVFYTTDSLAVKEARLLARDAGLDIDVVAAVYRYVTENITYDHEKALNPPSGYLSSVDETLLTGKGICLDYAALMACMLRSQRIPTRLEVGYAGEVYHAWISVYLPEEGWVDHIIYFDGQRWSLMDPTFAANMDRRDFDTFMEDGSHYLVKYIY